MAGYFGRQPALRWLSNERPRRARKLVIGHSYNVLAVAPFEPAQGEMRSVKPIDLVRRVNRTANHLYRRPYFLC
jgi:hypothetical protein